MNLTYIACGLGAPSIGLTLLWKQGIIKADCVMIADTGSENDRQLPDGARTSNAQIYADLKRLWDSWGLPSYFARTRDKQGNDLPPLIDAVESAAINRRRPEFIPVYGSRNGRSLQSCTDKWKIRAMQQQARRMGAKTEHALQGLTVDELHRINGRPEAIIDGFQTYRTVKKRWRKVTVTDLFGETHQRQAVIVSDRRRTHAYPWIDLNWKRDAIAETLRREGIPYLESSECDHCPHQDVARWRRHSPEVIERVARIESLYEGQHFFTDRRIPLRQALTQMGAAADRTGCETGGFCFV